MKAVLPLLLLSLSCLGADFYVATTGDDVTGDGSISKPFATIKKAESSARALGNTVQKNIWVRGGNYYNVNNIFWGNHYQVASYPGENAVLYGGQLLTGWASAGSNNCWVASLGTFPTTIQANVSDITTWAPRMLMVDGVSVPRAVLPESGRFYWSTFTGYTNLVYTNTLGASTNMELCVDKSWTDAEVVVTNCNTDTKTLTCTPAITGWTGAEDVKSYRMENLPEGVTADLMWWWDKTNNQIQIRSAVDPNGKTIIVPTTTRIFKVYGGEASNLMTNVVFSNLTFSVTTAGTSIGGSFAGADHVFALQLDYTTNAAVVNCVFTGIAGNAVGANRVHGLVLTNNSFTDIGVAGVSLNDSKGFLIQNNTFTGMGKYCRQGTGIYAYRGNGRITQNSITNTAYSGIAISALTSDIRPGYTVDHNFIKHAMTWLRDGGGIYVSATSNALIATNIVTTIGEGQSDRLHGLYNDQYSVGNIWLHNQVYDCSYPIMCHDNTNTVWATNWICSTLNANMTISLEHVVSNVFDRMVIQGPLMVGIAALDSDNHWMDVSAIDSMLNWTNSIFYSAGNIYSNTVPTYCQRSNPFFRTYNLVSVEPKRARVVRTMPSRTQVTRTLRSSYSYANPLPLDSLWSDGIGKQ